MERKPMLLINSVIVRDMDSPDTVSQLCKELIMSVDQKMIRIKANSHIRDVGGQIVNLIRCSSRTSAWKVLDAQAGTYAFSGNRQTSYRITGAFQSFRPFLRDAEPDIRD